MFAHDKNIFSSHSNMKHLFNNVNRQLNKIWFKANKLSLIEGKTKYTFFHKFRQKDNIPLKLPTLAFNGKVIKRTTLIKFLGVLLDENLSRKNHISVVEKKVSKNIIRGNFFRLFCDQKNIPLIANGNIKEEHLGVKKLHLNKRGNSLFAKNLLGFIEQT